ncbi:hypothetical protein IMG5_177520, partial [Ichthyophthirius multifiliis]
QTSHQMEQNYQNNLIVQYAFQLLMIHLQLNVVIIFAKFNYIQKIIIYKIKGCILETINRYHKCPFCQTILNESEIFPEYSLNNVKNTILQEYDKASLQTIEEICDYKDQGFKDNIVKILKEKFAETAILYISKFEENIKNIQTKKKEIQNQINQIQKSEKNYIGQLKYQDIKLQLDQLEIQEKVIYDYFIQSIQKYFQQLQKPEILEIKTDLIILKKNYIIKNFYIQPTMFINDFKQILIQTFLQKNNPIQENLLKLENIYIVSVPLEFSQQINNNFQKNNINEMNQEQIQEFLQIQNQNFNQQINFSQLFSLEIVNSLQIKQGSTIFIIGNIPCNQIYQFNVQLTIFKKDSIQIITDVRLVI